MSRCQLQITKLSEDEESCAAHKNVQKKNQWWLSNLQATYCTMLLSCQVLHGMYYILFFFASRFYTDDYFPPFLTWIVLLHNHMNVLFQDTKCPVPFCPNIKHKMKQQQLQQRVQQAQLLRRRMAVMNSRPTAQTSSSVTSTPVPSAPSNPVTAMASGAVSPVTVAPGQAMQQGQPNVPPTSVVPSLMQSHQPGMGMKPGTQTPPANVLQVVKQVN